MLKKGQGNNFAKPVSNMRLVYQAIESGCTIRIEVMKETGLPEGKVRSAIWNLSYIGAIKRVDDGNGKSRYILPTMDVGNCFKGVSSIFNIR